MKVICQACRAIEKYCIDRMTFPKEYVARQPRQHHPLFFQNAKMAVFEMPPLLKAALEVDGFGRTKLVRTEKPDQFGIMPVDQGIDFFLTPSCRKWSTNSLINRSPMPLFW